ncbi:cell division initiation protein [Microbacterium sp. SORGH_AS_0888]|uniref:cell division initiation protein n=1 Tax=Microbacterium sp. SORGH_AS_0888 TaxID=3041791 RepID=UPI002784D316|nr:cell division initiation protein [Microbacterium sp. SORGH_AS_0888]MDQ1130418.1 cell division septum initiation protein DivIVA [Microbacterium sp. SORGH_AS_0888]
MTDPNPPARDGSPFDELMQQSPGEAATFTVAFRGYERHEVDAAIADLSARLQQASAQVASLDDTYRDEIDRLRSEQHATIDALRAENDEALERLGADLAAARAQASEAEQQIAALSAQLVDAPAREDGEEPASRQQFEAVLRVAEEQANVLIQNAAVQAERLLEAAREEAATRRAEVDADVARIASQAQHDADQLRLRMETEFTAHEARIQRESAHAAEKVAQAEQEAATIRTEAEKGAAALRAMVTRETTQLRADAERDVREMNARVLEFEETLTRRQDDAQQEFLVLHNQAVAHAERITADANEQVASSLEHAQRISAKADDYERLMRAQAAQIEADAQVRARETLDRARVKAQKIVDSVTGHTTGVLRDAEDRTRQLRWQQQQLTSFMAEVRELIRPDGVAAPDEEPGDEAGDPSAPQD